MITGFDLGTTFSAIAYVNRDGKAEIITNRDGERTTPAVVLFEDGGRQKESGGRGPAAGGGPAEGRDPETGGSPDQYRDLQYCQGYIGKYRETE